MKRLALVGVCFAMTFGGVEAQSSDAGAAIESILTHSMVDNIVAGQGDAFVAAVQAQLGESADSPNLGPVVAAEFAAEKMRRDVASAMFEESLPVILDELNRLLSSGAIAEISEIQAEYQPPESIQDFAQSLQTAPPPQERIQLVAHWAQVQGAGEFYLILDEATRSAAHAVAAAVKPEGVAVFEPLTMEAYQARFQQGFEFALVSFLHRFRPVPDELLARAIAEYESEAGQWYVESYSVAVARAIELAGERTIERLAGG